MTMISTINELTLEFSPAVVLFRSLADPVRLRLLQRLADSEARIVDLTNELGLAQSTVSTHVSCLRECGLVIGRPEGRQMFYKLSRPELIELLGSAENLLAATNHQVALCPRYGKESDTR
jgi:DNA-binding transcriptional ArsR family regulator